MQYFGKKFIIYCIVFLSLSCREPRQPQYLSPEIESGILNLKGYDIPSSKIPLKGFWEFYWNEFRLDFPGNPNSLYYPVPSHWTEIPSPSGFPYPREGFATYRVTILLPLSTLKNKKLGLKIPPMDTAFVLFWNGMEIFRNGNVYKEKGNIFPIYYAPVVKELPNPLQESNSLVIHMANSLYPRPGLRDTIYLGDFESLLYDHITNLAIDTFLCGALFIIGLYHFGLWILRSIDLSPLYFGILSTLIMIRIGITGEAIAYKFFPLTWKVSTFLEYFTFYASSGILILFIHSLYPKNTNQLINSIFYSIIFLFLSILFLTPINLYTQTLVVFEIVTVLIALYVFYILIQAIQDKQESAIGFLLAIIVFLSSYVNDALYSLRIIDSFYTIGFGIFTFFFAQAFLLSRRSAKAFQTAEILTKELENKVRERTRDLEKEKERSDNLLKNILPTEIAQELKENGIVKPMYYPSVSVMFIDFVNFTKISEKMNPKDLVHELDKCFRAFDEIIERNGLEKLKTIGDAYMCVSGLPIPNKNHAIQCYEAALEIQTWMNNYRAKRKREGKLSWGFRIGIHSGNVTAGVIGAKKFAYDIWGDTVNVASRVESYGKPNKINMSETTYQLIHNSIHFYSKRIASVKGKGKILIFSI